MLSNLLEHRLLSSLLIAGLLLVGLFVFSPDTAEATTCFDTQGERNAALPITDVFPRPQLTRRSGDCAPQSTADSWALVSSYYNNGGNNQSALQTGRARFSTFYQGSAPPPDSQLIFVYWTSRCEYSGRAQVVSYDPVLGRVVLGELFNPMGATQVVPFWFSAKWQNGGAKYGTNVWKAGSTIAVEVTDAAGSEMSCRVRVANGSGARISFFEDANSGAGYVESGQRYNHENWTSSTKRYLGPNTNSGAYALYSGWRDGNGAPYNLEYALPFATACDITVPTVTRMRIYDMDHPSNSVFGGPSPGPLQFATPYMRLYNETTNSIVPVGGLPANGEVIIGNDEYREYTFTATPGHRYTWVFWNIQANNGVQIWMPFSEVHASFGCPASWDYDPNVPTPKTSNARYYAGTNFGINGNVTNSGGSTGPNYVQEFNFSQSAYIGNDPRVSSANGLGAGGTRTHNTGNNYFSIASNAPHNAQVTCRNRVSPNTPDDDTQTVVNNNCFTFYNRRYNIRRPDTSSVTINPSVILPGQNFTVTVDVCNNENVPNGATGGPAPNVTTTISASTNANGTTRSYFDSSVGRTCDSVSNSGPRVFTGTAQSAPTAQLGDNVCVVVSINRNTGFSDGFGASNGGNSQQFCVEVAEQAYLTVDNGSVWAGGDFDPSPNGVGTPWCAVPGGSDDGYISAVRFGSIGAFADYLVGATDTIEGFGSAGAPNGSLLTLANTPSLGRFHSEGRCITNFISYLSTDTSMPSVRSTTGPGGANFPDGNGQWIGPSSDVTYGAQTIPQGRRITLLVDGDVTLTGDIACANYYAGTRADIPSFILIATGNIDIHGSVQRLDGVYISQGQIDTCSDGPASLSSAACRNQLNVNGSFIANDIEFRRTYGGVSGANPNGNTAPAEVFVHNPEIYLAESFLIADRPVRLQIDNQVDLPPVIN